MDNEVKEEVKVETKKKGNGLFTLFACIMTGVIVFLATNVGQKASKVVDPDTNGGSKESNVTSNVESNTTSNVESNATSNVTSNQTSSEIDPTIKRAVTEKFMNLFSGNLSSQGDKKFFETGNLGSSLTHYDKIFENKLTDVDKTYIMLLGLYPDTAYDYKTGVFKDKDMISTIKTMVNDAPVVDAYEKSTFAYRYKNVFGTEPSYVDANGCPGYFYDSKNQLYVSVGMCGGDSSSDVLVYRDSIFKENNAIVVSAYVGGELIENGKLIVYKDYKFSKENILEETKQTDKEITITEQNKTKFTKYNFIFEKGQNGEYYFKSVAKTK